MDPTYELIKKTMDVLKENESLVTALGGPKIFDRVASMQDGTPNVESPYISVGNSNFSTDDFDCVDATTVSLQFHVWSWGDGEAYSSAEVRKLAFLVRKALHKAELDLDTNGLVALNHVLTTFNRAPDGVTHQGVVIFEAEIDLL